jgi:RNA polymerase sigma-70 factor (ECF subfamily)
VVWEKVAELPEAQREVVTLKYAEDLNTEEIAKVTKKSRGAVRILLHRAKLRLRHSLEGKDLL